MPAAPGSRRTRRGHRRMIIWTTYEELSQKLEELIKEAIGNKMIRGKDNTDNTYTSFKGFSVAGIWQENLK